MSYVVESVRNLHDTHMFIASACMSEFCQKRHCISHLFHKKELHTSVAWGSTSLIKVSRHTHSEGFKRRLGSRMAGVGWTTFLNQVCTGCTFTWFLKLFLCGHLYVCLHVCVCVLAPEAINN